MKKGTASSGASKMTNYFKSLVDLDDFDANIKELRRKHSIPVNGYGARIYKRWANGIDPLDPPKEWLSEKGVKQKKLWCDIASLQERYDIHELSFDFALFEYVFFGNFEQSLSLYWGVDTCEIRNLPFEQEYLKNVNSKILLSNLREGIKKSVKQYPIIVGISPYATLGDITSFVVANKERITKFQAEYKKAHINIGHYRNRITRERNNYILQNHKLSRKTISRLVFEHFGQKLDEIYIRNIIAKEKSARKKV